MGTGWSRQQIALCLGVELTVVSDLLRTSSRRFSIERLAFFLGRAGLRVEVCIDGALAGSTEPGLDQHWKDAGGRLRLALIDGLRARAAAQGLGAAELAKRLGEHRPIGSQVMQQRCDLLRVQRLADFLGRLGSSVTFVVAPGHVSGPPPASTGGDAATRLRVTLIDRIVHATEGWPREEAMARLGVSRAGLTKLTARQVDHFTADRLALLLERLGIRVDLLLDSAAWPPDVSTAFEPHVFPVVEGDGGVGTQWPHVTADAR
ncbi:MAG TPA: XRE family transcriptional regulator [Rhodothermales bacterium]|nr:XRE family transcriptional regulator [Rhodothermales bacterium]